MVHRIVRMRFRIGHTPIDSNAPAYASKGVLEFEHTVIAVHPSNPAIAMTYRRSFRHCKMNSGKSVAPNAPAVNEC
jgi:hypothetical protein